jgi:hypothetical protein
MVEKHGTWRAVYFRKSSGKNVEWHGTFHRKLFGESGFNLMNKIAVIRVPQVYGDQ